MKLFRVLLTTVILLAGSYSFSEGFDQLAKKTKVQSMELTGIIDAYQMTESISTHLDELRIGLSAFQVRSKNAKTGYVEAYLPGVYEKQEKQIRLLGPAAESLNSFKETFRGAVKKASFVSAADREDILTTLDSLFPSDIDSPELLNNAIADIRSLQAKVEKTHFVFRLIKLNRIIDEFSDEMFRYIVLDSKLRTVAAQNGEGTYSSKVGEIILSGDVKEGLKKISVSGFSKAHMAALKEILSLTDEFLVHDDLLSETNVSNIKNYRDAIKKLQVTKIADAKSILLTATLVSQINDELTSFEPRIIFQAVNNDLVHRGKRIEDAVERALLNLARKSANDEGAFKIGYGPYGVSGKSVKDVKEWTVAYHEEYLFIRLHRLNTYLRRIMMGGAEIELNGVTFKTEGADLLNKEQRQELSKVRDSLADIIFSDRFVNSTDISPLLLYFKVVTDVKKTLGLKSEK